MDPWGTSASSERRTLALFLCGDCMLGRGIDQILPHPGSPILHETYVKDARTYVALAEDAGGKISVPVDFSYVWGEAIPLLDRFSPAARIINLETAITTSDDAWEKGINYRMHPANVPCLAAARIECCNLANNHVLDWGFRGLEETLDVLRRERIAICGAGRDLDEAEAPAILERWGHRILVFGFSLESSGVPPDWSATKTRPGVTFLAELSSTTVQRIGERCRAVKREGDLAIASIHWGGNWGFPVPEAHRRFAHALIDTAGIDLIHGHSSHHVLGFEVYRGKLILYGCGDLINDYEGIGGYEIYRGDLGLLYLPSLHPDNGTLSSLTLVPMRMRRLRLERASGPDALWLQQTLNREGRPFGTRVVTGAEGFLFWVAP